MDRSFFVDTLRTNLSRTPGMQRVRQYFSFGPVNDDEQPDAGDVAGSVEVLLKQTWNLWGVSSLYGFEDSELQLKHYGKKMREEVAAILPHEEFTYDAKFALVEDMERRPSASDPIPIKIEVVASPIVNQTPNETPRRPEKIEKNIYTGIMLSWRTAVTELDYDKCVKLPLLLCRGTKSAMKAVHLTLGHMFDCHVVPLSATEDDLKWLVPIVLQPVGQDDVRQKGEVRLEYRIPGLPITDSITIKIDASDLANMWSVVSKKDANDSEEMSVRARHIEKFYEVLNEQMLQTAGLQLGYCKLHKISLPSFTIMENRMKASSPTVMSKILLFFNEKALEILHQLNFDTTVSTNNTSQL